MMKARKILLIVLISGALFVFSRCVGRDNVDPRGSLYAGSAACVKCHAEISRSTRHTAHFLSTTIAGDQTVKGSFVTGNNIFSSGDGKDVVMEKTDSGLYQVLQGKGIRTRRARFDLVMGSVKGQSYIYRRSGGFYQLPVSWLAATGRWSGSPGFTPGHPTFDRPVVAGCFACHSGWVSETAAAHPEQAVWPIDCERCHGPAAVHVDFHERHPQEKTAHDIVAFSNLSRDQKIAVCGMCHSGTKQTTLRSAFAFHPGDSLSRFLIPDFTGTLPVDVHGNQTRLLENSRCFADSRLDCGTCHDTHKNQRGETALFNQACAGCHAAPGGKNCPLAKTGDAAFIQANCTRCHMPAQPSALITIQTGHGAVLSPTLIVNHRIAVYADVSAAVLKNKHS